MTTPSHFLRRSLCLLLALCGAATTQSEPLPKNWRAQHWRDIGPYTYNLREADAVELHRFEDSPEAKEPEDPSKMKIVDTKRFTGAEAARIAQLWRDQDWVGFGASCHEPVYGITFYRGDQKLFFGSICFGCQNVYLYGGKTDTAGFNRESRAYPVLRSLFKEIWGQ
ncbi:MAG: hypothetical protein ABJF10_02860 [Chthoniobacter sp.]|uniref:hypothetical protein n=1 Tax=Chthoniobacter sp. TaxID=2510640 RepID=UPI0032A2AA44